MEAKKNPDSTAIEIIIIIILCSCPPWQQTTWEMQCVPGSCQVTHNDNRELRGFSLCAFCISLCRPYCYLSTQCPIVQAYQSFLEIPSTPLEQQWIQETALESDIGLSVGNMNVSVSFCSFMKQLLLKISLQQCIIISIGLRKSPQNSSVSRNDDLLLKKCDATLRLKKKEGRKESNIYVNLSITDLGISCSLSYARPCHTVGGCFCTSYTCTRPRF